MQAISRYHFASVCYTTEQRFHSRTKFSTFDDQGILDSTLTGCVFRGRKHVIALDFIEQIRLIGQPIAWAPFFGVSLIYLVIMNTFIPLLFYLVVGLGIPSLIVIFFNGVYVCCAFIGIGIAMAFKWVEVLALDEQHNLRSYYFSDGSYLGFGGLFGGTRQLYNTLSTVVTRPMSRQ